MRSRKVALTAALLVVALLLVTLNGVMARPLDGISAAWLMAAFAVLACITAFSAWSLVRPLWQGKAFNKLDAAFWIAFVVLPICLWLLNAVGWNLLEWYRD